MGTEFIMITITEKAKEELKKLLDSSVDWPGARLRLLDRGEGRLGLGVDIESRNDHVVEYRGEKLLLVEADLASKLERVTLDVEEKASTPELVISEA
jgi:Fe-S cluster assembly iron-binding protein IscA